MEAADHQLDAVDRMMDRPWQVRVGLPTVHLLDR
jgi:hypothetical protein